MKTWARIFVLLGVIWVIILLGASIILYLEAKKVYNQISWSKGGEVVTINNSWRRIIEIVYVEDPIKNLPNFLYFGIPAWVLFILAGIWGRDKKEKRVMQRNFR